MINRNYILFVISLLLFTMYNCKTTPKLVFSIPRLDSTITATKISIPELANNYKTYQGRYIETTGTFYYAFEQFSIHTDKDLLTRESQGFWLKKNHDLRINDSQFEKMNGKRVTIKGSIDTTSTGHLGLYLATIKEIYFLKQQ